MLQAIRRCAVVFVWAAIGTFTTAQAGERLNDFRGMQGTWTLLYGERAGMQFSYDVSGMMRLVVSGNRYAMAPQTPGAATGWFVLDASRWPRRIDFTPMTGPNAGQTLRGIYEILGDTQKVCFAAPGQPRPTSFSTVPGSDQMTYVWLRLDRPSLYRSRFRSVAPEFDFEVR